MTMRSSGYLHMRRNKIVGNVEQHILLRHDTQVIFSLIEVVKSDAIRFTYEPSYGQTILANTIAPIVIVLAMRKFTWLLSRISTPLPIILLGLLFSLASSTFDF